MSKDRIQMDELRPVSELICNLFIAHFFGEECLELRVNKWWEKQGELGGDW